MDIFTSICDALYIYAVSSQAVSISVDIQHCEAEIQEESPLIRFCKMRFTGFIYVLLTVFDKIK